MEARSFPTGDILALITDIAPLGIRTEVENGQVRFVSDDALLEHLCGSTHPLEYGMVAKVAREELERQFPWATRAAESLARLPEDADWVTLWAWLDATERRYGGEHPVVPLPREWRRSIPVSEFHGHRSDGVMVDYPDLPAWMRSVLRHLGYREE